MNLCLWGLVITKMGMPRYIRLDLSQGEYMEDIDDFRFSSQELVELDAANTKK